MSDKDRQKMLLFMEGPSGVVSEWPLNPLNALNTLEYETHQLKENKLKKTGILTKVLKGKD